MNLKAMQRMAQEFPKDGVPPFPCPTCGDPLKARADEIHLDPSAESQFHFDNEGDPTMLFGIFTLRLVCSNPSCNEPANCTGLYRVVSESDTSGEILYRTMLAPAFFTPTIHIFPIPSKLPDKIRNPLMDSFSTFWANPSAAGNSLRISVEALMDYRCEKKWTTEKDGKEKEIPLHHRIVAFQKKSPHIGEKLLAIKWLGNSGSHLTGLQRKDVIKGYLLYSHVLEELFEKRTETLDAMARKINKRKGPA